jgi:hypothetical protein
MTLKYVTVNNIKKLIYSPYKTKEKRYKLHWKMKRGTDIYMSTKLQKFSSDKSDLQLGQIYTQETPEFHFSWAHIWPWVH